jgi:hypothetical protein
MFALFLRNYYASFLTICVIFVSLALLQEILKASMGKILVPELMSQSFYS